MRDVSFQELGGRAILEKFAKAFYDKVYADPWLGKFFEHIPQEHIETQQVDFLEGALGGRKVFCGKLPKPAHQHIRISEELFELRNRLVLEALQDVGASPALVEKITKIDNAFKRALVKSSIEECTKRFTSDTILDFLKP